MTDIGNIFRRELALFHHLCIAEDYGQRCAKFVSDIGEERYSHLIHLLLCQLLALTVIECIDEEGDNDGSKDDDEEDSGYAHHLERSLGAVFLVDGVHFGASLLMLIAYAYLLHVDEILLACHAVAQFIILLIEFQSIAVVAFFMVDVVVEPRHLRLMFERFEPMSHVVSNGEIMLCLGMVAFLDVYLRQSKAWLHSMPLVVR